MASQLTVPEAGTTPDESLQLGEETKWLGLPLMQSHQCPTFVSAVTLTWEMLHPPLNLHIPPTF